MIFFNKKQPKVIPAKDQLFNLFNSLSYDNKEKMSFLTNLSYHIYRAIIKSFIPKFEEEHKKELTDIQKEMLFYIIGTSLRIYNFEKCDIMKLPNKSNIRTISLYKNCITTILINTINKGEKRVNSFDLLIDEDISISFVQLLVMIYFFEKKEYSGSLFKNYTISYNNYIIIVDECISMMYDTLLENKSSLEKKFLDSVENMTTALIDTYCFIIHSIMEHT